MASSHEGLFALVEKQHGATLGLLSRGQGVDRADRRFSDTRRAYDECGGAAREAAASEGVDLFNPALECGGAWDRRIACGDEPGIDNEAASANGEIMCAAMISATTQLPHAQPSPVGAKIKVQLLEFNDAVSERLAAQVLLACRCFVQYNCRARMGACEITNALELAAVKGRRWGHYTEARNGVENDKRRP